MQPKMTTSLLDESNSILTGNANGSKSLSVDLSFYTAMGSLRSVTAIITKMGAPALSALTTVTVSLCRPARASRAVPVDVVDVVDAGQTHTSDADM